MKRLRKLRQLTENRWTDGGQIFQFADIPADGYVFVPNAILGRLLTVNADRKVVSVSHLSGKVKGTTGRVTSTDDGSGGVAIDFIDSAMDTRYYTQAQVVALITTSLQSIVCHDGEVLVHSGEVLTHG